MMSDSNDAETEYFRAIQTDLLYQCTFLWSLTDQGFGIYVYEMD